MWIKCQSGSQPNTFFYLTSSLVKVEVLQWFYRPLITLIF